MSSPTPLILASASPRRNELLSLLRVPFSVVPADVDETAPEELEDPVTFARQLAEAKAREIAKRYPGVAVLAADTIVVLDSQILGKPANAVEARETLQLLRNGPHEVTTALALVHDAKIWINHATTTVVMRQYSNEEIDAYIATGDPYDKAGSYAIQDRQFNPVTSCNGCYCNVVGLPLVLVQRMLEEASLTIHDLYPPDLPQECHSCPLNVSKPRFNPPIDMPG